MSFRLLIASTGVLVLLGCASQRRVDYCSSRPISVVEPSAEADHLWASVQETLRRQQFQLDRIDRTAGVITTKPETSRHFFEFWRKDVATARDAWEATVNPLRRWVEVRLAPGEDESWNEISVLVHKERLSSPDRQFNSTGAAYQYFGESLPSTLGQHRVTAQLDRWYDVGRDPAMEDHLLREITEACAAVEASRAQGQPSSVESSP